MTSNDPRDKATAQRQRALDTMRENAATWAQVLRDARIAGNSERAALAEQKLIECQLECTRLEAAA